MTDRDLLTPAGWEDQFLTAWPVRRVHPLDAAWIAHLDHDLDLAQAMLRVPLEARPWPDAPEHLADVDNAPEAILEPPPPPLPPAPEPKPETLAPPPGGRLLGAYARRAASKG